MYQPKHFTFAEMLQSETATKLGIRNYPETWAQVFNLLRLIELVLDPLREEYGKPVHINSAFRSPRLNALIGGVVFSQHLDGLAADIDVSNFNRAVDILAKNKNVDQLLFEHKQGKRWIHVSIAAQGKKPRNQVNRNYIVK